MTYKTDRREIIIAFFKERREEAFSLDEVCDLLLDEGRGKSTLYRIVAELTRCGMLKKLSEGDSRHCKYQYVGEAGCSEHIHLKCLECGRLIHLDHEKTEETKRVLRSLDGFELDESSFLFGRCSSCKAKG